MIEIRKCLVNYFKENNTPDTSSITQWEAHKCIIRGKLFSLAARIKKEKQSQLKEMFDKLKTLEALHKRTLAQQSHLELTEVRTLIQDEIGKNIRKKFTLSQKLFYEFGNKRHLLWTRTSPSPGTTLEKS